MLCLITTLLIISAVFQAKLMTYIGKMFKQFQIMKYRRFFNIERLLLLPNGRKEQSQEWTNEELTPEKDFSESSPKASQILLFVFFRNTLFKSILPHVKPRFNTLKGILPFLCASVAWMQGANRENAPLQSFMPCLLLSKDSASTFLTCFVAH